MKIVKDKKKRLLLLIPIIIIISLVISAILYSIGNNTNKLSLDENKWLDSNKYNVIDISVLNNIPTVSYSGKGILYSYLDYMTKEYSLKFNVVPYNADSTVTYDYTLNVKNKVDSNDIEILDDDLVLILKNDVVCNDFTDLIDKKIGILNSDKSDLTDYFNNINVEFVEYDSYNILNDAFNNDNEDDDQIDGIITLKTLFMREIIENEYVVSFEFNDLNRYFVISSNGSKELTSILKKGHNKWSLEYFDDEYKTQTLNSYYTFKNISDVNVKNLQSKSYVYGFVDYGIYNNLAGNKMSGLTSLILRDFSKFSNLSMKFTRYNSINKLVSDFQSGKVDLILNIVNTNYSNVYSTINVFDSNVVVISGNNNNTVVDSIYSLKNKEILTVKDTTIEKYLLGNNITVKSFNNMNDLAKSFNNNSIAVVDLENYNYYKTSAFKEAKINYLFKIDEGYNFIINNLSNETFGELFNFYLNFSSINKIIDTNYYKVAYKNVNITYILIIIIIALLFYVIVDFSGHFKVMIKAIRKNRKIHLSKEDKIKFIDQLTSLKNRAYFNSKIEAWDDSEVYPQSIIIVDLNNISYINDNYGREEGDKVITEAANILIQYQLENTEIIRTDGNEFLIYMVGYNEKQVIAYLRRLNKEFKGLSHGFGAASGYSIITDAIKTIDDAVNEATLDMKNNKEDINY